MQNLTAVVPYYNGERTIERLLESIPANLTVIVVNDQSDAPPPSGVFRSENVRVMELPDKSYFAGAVNAGIRAAGDSDVLVLNQDVWLEGTQWLDLLAENRDRYALIGECITGDHPAFPEGYPHGVFCFFRRDALNKVGLLDEKRFPLWGNTAEWQWRICRQGFESLPLAEIPGLHHKRKPGERYGSSIRQLLEKEPDKRDLLIRTPPLISVVIPCYNYGRFLPECIASLIGGKTKLGVMPGQTFQAFEAIIVDDASRDDSAEIAASLADPWKGIKFVQRPKNGGTAKALNTGIKLAVGKYITFLSADDMRRPRGLEALYEKCEANPHSFAYDEIQYFNGGRYLRVRKVGWMDKERKRVDFNFEHLLQQNQIHAGILYPRQAWVDVGGYPEVMNDGREDWAFNIALGAAGYCGKLVEEYNYLYRWQGQNRSQRNTNGIDRARFAEKIRNLFPALYEGRRPVGCCGKGENNAPAKQSAGLSGARMAAAAMPGSSGMMRLEYTGGKQLFTVYGQKSRTNYRFGATRRIGWVDQRDVGVRGESGFLNQMENGQYVFRVLRAPDKKPASPQPAKPEPKPEPVKSEPKPEPQPEQPQLEPEPEPVTVDVPDPAELTVAEIRSLNLTPAQWKRVAELERAGKARSTVLSLAERKVE